MHADPLEDLVLLLRSRPGLIVIDTPEDDRAETVARLASDRASLPFFLWSRTKGLRRDGGDQAIYLTADPTHALAHIAGARIEAS